LAWEGRDFKDLGMFFKRMEFRTLTKKYLGESAATMQESNTSSATSLSQKNKSQGDLFGSYVEEAERQKLDEKRVDYRLISNLDELSRMVNTLLTHDKFCFDTETDSPDPVSAQLV